MATVAQQRETYDKLFSLFGVIEGMLSAIEHPGVENAEDQLQVSEQFIRQAAESTETIINLFMNHVKEGRAPTDEESKAIEIATRKVFIEIANLISNAKLLEKAA